MIMAQERMILKGQVQLEEMAALVRQAAKDGRPIDQVERSLWQSMLALGRTMLSSYVEAVGAGDLGAALAPGGGEVKVQRMLGLARSVRSLEQMSVSRAGAVEEFRTSQPVPPPAEEGEIVV